MSQTSYVSTDGVDFAARQEISFVCTANGHIFTRVFSDEITPPTDWDCPRCGSPASRGDGTPAPDRAPARRRTHWDMLRERRSMEELEQLLAERLRELRAAQEQEFSDQQADIWERAAD
jgi:hypothetical protein